MTTLFGYFYGNYLKTNVLKSISRNLSSSCLRYLFISPRRCSKRFLPIGVPLLDLNYFKHLKGNDLN